MKTLKEALFSKRNLKKNYSLNNIIEFKNSNGEIWKFEYLEYNYPRTFKAGIEDNYVLLSREFGTYLYKNIVMAERASCFSVDTKKYLWYDKDGIFSILNSRGSVLNKIKLDKNDLFIVRDWLKEHFYSHRKNTKI